jgi:hypothetical protein
MTDDDNNPYRTAPRWELESELLRRDRETGEPSFTTAQISDAAFYRAHKDAIHRAARLGRITEAEPVDPRPAPTYEPSIIPGWKAVGQDIYEATAPPPQTKDEEPKP